MSARINLSWLTPSSSRGSEYMVPVEIVVWNLGYPFYSGIKGNGF